MRGWYRIFIYLSLKQGHGKVVGYSVEHYKAKSSRGNQAEMQSRVKVSTWPFTQPPTIIFESEGQNSKARMSSGHSSSNCKDHRNPHKQSINITFQSRKFPFIGCLPSQVFIYSSLSIQSSAFNPQNQIHIVDSISSSIKGEKKTQEE